MYLRSLVPGALFGVAVIAAVMMLLMPAEAARRKGRSCMADHFHYGSSSGKRSKKIARTEAIASWSEFTAFEYGNAWAYFRRARSRSVRCSENETGWGCKVEAVPCR